MLKIILNLSKINVLSQYKISEKLAVFILPIIILGFNQKFIVPSLINILFCLIMVKVLEIPFRIYRKFVGGVSLFIVFGMIPLFIDHQIDQAVVIIFRTIASMSSVFLFSVTTPADDIFYGLYKVNFLKEFSEIGRTMLRFLVIIEDEYKRIKYAMESRYGFSRNSEKLKNYSKLLGVLFINTMNKWNEMEESLISRGYRGYLNFTQEEKRGSGKLVALAAAYNILLITIIIFMKGQMI